MQRKKESGCFFSSFSFSHILISHTFTQGGGRGGEGSGLLQSDTVSYPPTEAGPGWRHGCLPHSLRNGSWFHYQTALPPCSNPSILCSHRLRSLFQQGKKNKKNSNTPMNGGKKHPRAAAAHKTQTQRRSKRGIDKREFVVGHGASKELDLPFQLKETFKLIPAVAHV